MKAFVIGMCALATLLGTGCAHNSFVGSNGRRAGQFFGSVGVTGSNNEVTVQSGSRLKNISIIGDLNNFMVEDGVTLQQIEFYGTENTVSVPEGLTVRVTQFGPRNQVIRRPNQPWHGAAGPEGASAEPAPYDRWTLEPQPAPEGTHGGPDATPPAPAPNSGDE